MVQCMRWYGPDDPVSLVSKAVRPGFTEKVRSFDNMTLEDKLKEWGKEAAEKNRLQDLVRILENRLNAGPNPNPGSDTKQDK